MIVSIISCSTSQNNNEFQVFLSNMKKLLSNINNYKPSLSVITGDFNARSSTGGVKTSTLQKEQICIN